MKKNQLEFVIVGCGNLAWHLANKISSLSQAHLTVYNHKPNPQLEKFKKKFNCKVSSQLNEMNNKADYYFICVSDKAIATIANKLKIDHPNALLMHTSGSQSIEVLGKKNKNLAVYYPLQTFSKQDKLNWSKTPILIEANHPQSLTAVKQLATILGNKYFEINFQERLQLHLAAVLVNNFTNALYVEAFKLLPKENKNNFNLLLPIMKQGIKKIEKVHPLLAQTGPAKRHDTEVMKQHLNLLKNNSQLKDVYEKLSNLIISQQKNIT